VGKPRKKGWGRRETRPKVSGRLFQEMLDFGSTMCCDRTKNTPHKNSSTCQRKCGPLVYNEKTHGGLVCVEKKGGLKGNARKQEGLK